MEDSTRKRWGAPSSAGADDEELAVVAAGHARLDAVEHEAVTGAGRGGRELAGVEERARLRQRQRRGGDVVLGLGEGRQVGRLLLLGAPQRQRRADRGRRQHRDRQAHVALGQRLGHQGPGDGRALGGDAAEVLGDAEDRQADLVGRGQQLLRCLAGLVGVGRGGSYDLGGELGHDVDEHLLVLAGREVEDAGGLGRGDARAGALAALAGELAAHRAHGLEARARRGVDDLLRGLAQVEPVQRRALGEPVEQRDGEPDRVGLLRGGEPAAAAGVLGGLVERHG